MSDPSVLYHCPCSSAVAPPPNLPSSAYAFHDLNTLYFCEECDAIRCNRCVSVEVSTFYCPNCTFEVPSASVRAEKSRCARNCFQCPACQNILSIVSLNIVKPEDGPFILTCNWCRWDSTILNLEFPKGTGLAVQVQKYEDNAIDQHEFDRLRDHFEPLLRPLRNSTMFHASISHQSAITAAASAALRRDVRGLRQSTRSHVKPQEKKDVGADGHDFPQFKAFEFQKVDEEEEMDCLKGLTEVDEVTRLDQRLLSPWDETTRAVALRPLRVPLQSKKSKRCSTCRHILIKPEQKAQSYRFKIKLVAANYIPAMEVSKPQDSSLASRRRTGIPAPVSMGDDYLHPGRTYQFQMAFTNPLYDPINLRLALQDTPPRPIDAAAGRRPTFVVALPTNTITVAAFTDTWDYEEEDAMGEEDVTAQRPSGKEEKGRWKIGVVERRANVTKIGGELTLGNKAEGDIKFNVLVTYTYKSDDAQTEGEKSTAKTPTTAQLKTFAFWTVVHLGTVAPRETGADTT